MLRVARLPGLAALLGLITVSDAHAQTVIATNAPQGTTLEFVLETTVEGTATVNNAGTATVAAKPDHLGTRQLDATIFVDNCGTTRRVLVIDRLTQAPAPGTCTRTEINGIFIIQRITTLVANFGSTPPTLLVRQGPPPAAWLHPPTPGAVVGRIPYQGEFVLSGGGALTKFRDFEAVACGNLNNCTSDLTSRSLSAGLAYWFLPFLGAEAGYIKFSGISASATGTAFNFNSQLDGGLVTVAALGAVPLGKVKIFGKGGLNYHRATFTTDETIADATATVDSVTQAIAGGSQTLQTRTGGWGWLWGGGIEVWVKRPVGFYGEIGRVLVSGSDTRGGEGTISDPVTYVVVGAKVRFPDFW